MQKQKTNNESSQQQETRQPNRKERRTQASIMRKAIRAAKKGKTK